MRPSKLLLVFFLASPAFAGDQLLWSDEFDSGSAPNPAVWSYDLGRGSDGWGNAELQSYTNDPANVRIEDGLLKITVQENNGSFTSARIKTEDKLTFRYATIEARIRVPDLADGLWPAFWTLGNNFSEVGWPFCGELDIMEMGNSAAINQGVVNRRVASTAHWGTDGCVPGVSCPNYGLSLDAAQDLTGEFQIYRMEWTPTLVTTYLNGQQIWAIDITPDELDEFHEPHFAILNMAVGGRYTGRLSASSITAPMPAEMAVDYVRIYDNGFTEIGGIGFENTPPPIGPAHSGSWYNPQQNGHGFAMQFGNDAAGSLFAVVYWYIYDTDGSPLFFIGTGTPDGTGVDIEFLSPVGMRFGEFDADSLSLEEGGTARFEFDTTTTGIFSYTPSDFSATTWGHTPMEIELERFFPVDS
ncbi:MAG: glycoside hydrolase family 16 protein [Xanthomonadales bacterium]|nr:glycoside hydrolase family 16 protein [Xanthomonadales bacterium]